MSLVRSQLVSLEFFIDIKSFRSHYGPGVDSASNRNEYQEYFLGGKGGRCVRLTTYHHPVPLSRNLGHLTSWKPLGLFNRTGLPYTLDVKERSLPNCSFYAISDQLGDDGQKKGPNMSQRIKQSKSYFLKLCYLEHIINLINFTYKPHCTMIFP